MEVTAATGTATVAAAVGAVAVAADAVAAVVETDRADHGGLPLAGNLEDTWF